MTCWISDDKKNKISYLLLLYYLHFKLCTLTMSSEPASSHGVEVHASNSHGMNTGLGLTDSQADQLKAIKRFPQRLSTSFLSVPLFVDE